MTTMNGSAPIPSIRLPRPFWPFPPLLVEDAGGRAVQAPEATPPIPMDMVELLYQRPDIRAAVIALTPDLVTLLSANPAAAEVFNEMAGGQLFSEERIVPFIVAGVCLAAGLGLGIASRP